MSPAQLAEAMGACWTDVMRHGQRSMVDVVDQLDLSITHIKVLTALATTDEPLSVKALAERLGLSLPGTSRTVDGLTRRGWLARSEDPDDRRVRRVALTAEGRAVFERVQHARLEGLEAWAADLAPELRARLLDVLRDVVPTTKTEDPA
ncbi:MarR family winged helix-turn-helix transcriptional regulator [Conexibacter sp. SYSU D00693]|uniref:MarR family winged helix-turn-helix transcriptional regulator n=1 Tax=Conexibacter sp. SYSU D00693 TaxID=2812560 RepID=UPI00196B6CC4|nr:MarR family transcriptional regulator [Conexibacter sp. SYSU D00693]